MHPAPRRPARLSLTRRGRLARTLLAIILVLLIIGLVVLVRGCGGQGGSGGAAAASGSASTPASSAPASPDASASASAQESASASPSADPSPDASTSAAPAPTAEVTAAPGQMTHSGTVGDGTWSIAAVAAPVDPAGRQVRTYALRTENGTGIDADQAAQVVAAILADPRGWQPIAGVTFQQVADPAQAEFTISIGSPPTVDRMCAPARTGGTWSCRLGTDVVLNSNRWLFMTPTYSDLGAYRGYMVNHEVGHFLGHDHERCAGPGRKAPVMLQQSMDLGGCVANAWPAEDGQG